MISGPWFNFFAGLLTGVMLTLSSEFLMVLLVTWLAYRRARRQRQASVIDHQMRAAAERAADDLAAATSVRR